MKGKPVEFRWLHKNDGGRALQVRDVTNDWLVIPTVAGDEPPLMEPLASDLRAPVNGVLAVLRELGQGQDTLGRAQEQFSVCYATLLLMAYERGYRVRMGDVFRDPRAHGEHGAKGPYGASKSNHKLKLAGDVLLFRAGRYLKTTSDYLLLGLFWEGLGRRASLPLRWGGRFNDGNHFELKRGWQYKPMKKETA